MSTTFVLPQRNEATTTPERRGLARDGVRLLVTEAHGGEDRDAAFVDLPEVLRPNDLLVVNDSATIPAALTAILDDGRVFPLHLSTRIAASLWIAEPRASVRAGAIALLAEGASATFLAALDPARPRLWYVALAVPGAIDAYLARNGAPIRYRYVREELALEEFQTIFARRPGSAEMPSAGRPFSHAVLARLQHRDIRVAALTLHTGVASLERDEHPHAEWFEVPPATAAAVTATRRSGGRVVAVGTTVVRALESSSNGKEAIAARGWTDLIVSRQHDLAVVDGLLTGLHEPEASHLDLLRAFVDDAVLFDAYEHALGAGYLWHEFGDLQLILP